MAIDNRSMEEITERMNKADTEVVPQDKKGLSEKISGWLKKNITRTRDHSEGVDKSEDVAKNKKVERVLTPIINEISSSKSVRDLEKMKENTRAVVSSYDTGLRKLRESNVPTDRPTVSEQLSPDEVDLAVKMIYRKVQEKINRALVNIANDYLNDVQERAKVGLRLSKTDYEQNRRDLINFVNRSNAAVHLSSEDNTFMPFESTIMTAVNKNQTEIASNAFDYLHVYKNDTNLSMNELPKAA